MFPNVVNQWILIVVLPYNFKYNFNIYFEQIFQKLRQSLVIGTYSACKVVSLKHEQFMECVLL